MLADRLLERAEEFIWWAFTGLVTAMVSFIGWLVRRVITNQKQIELLQKEIKHRDQLRQEDREALDDVRQGVTRIETILMQEGYGDR